MFLLAEISDKMPSFASAFAGGLLFFLFFAFLAVLRWWLVVPYVLLLGFYNWQQIQEVWFEPIGRQILSELGPKWVFGQFVALNLLPVCAAPGFVSLMKKQRRASRSARRRRRGACGECGYPRTDPRCPECGHDHSVPVEADVVLEDV